MGRGSRGGAVVSSWGSPVRAFERGGRLVFGSGSGPSCGAAFRPPVFPIFEPSKGGFSSLLSSVGCRAAGG